MKKIENRVPIKFKFICDPRELGFASEVANWAAEEMEVTDCMVTSGDMVAYVTLSSSTIRVRVFPQNADTIPELEVDNDRIRH